MVGTNEGAFGAGLHQGRTDGTSARRAAPIAPAAGGFVDSCYRQSEAARDVGAIAAGQHAASNMRLEARDALPFALGVAASIMG
jgi:hypothetical protein